MTVQSLVLQKQIRERPYISSGQFRVQYQARSLVVLSNLVMLGILFLAVIFFLVQSNLITSRNMLLNQISKSFNTIYGAIDFQQPSQKSLSQLKSELQMVEVDLIEAVTLETESVALRDAVSH